MVLVLLVAVAWWRLHASRSHWITGLRKQTANWP
jgi:hypothetical protein